MKKANHPSQGKGKSKRGKLVPAKATIESVPI